MHLAIDGYSRDTKKLEDLELLRQFLDEYPASLGMTKLIPPSVLTYSGPVPEDWGLSGFVIIAESHISVHTFPARNYVNLDIFSCKGFDSNAALQFAQEIFSLHISHSWILERGLEHYNPEEAHQALEKERTQFFSETPQ
jgi:S-adenosylmethionine decarboxylase